MVGEGKFLVHGIEVRLEIDDVAMKVERKMIALEFEPAVISPSRQPLEQVQAGQNHGVR